MRNKLLQCRVACPCAYQHANITVCNMYLLRTQLATMGINTVRLPVGDWMYKPYGPYIGCTEGSLEQVSLACFLDTVDATALLQ